MAMQVHILLLAPFIVLALWVIWRAVTLPKWVRAAPVCGICGYEFTGGGRCPECGRDVAEGGVATQRLALRLRGSFPAAAAALLLITVTLWFFARDAALARLAQARYTQVAAKLTLLPESPMSQLPRVEMEKDTISTGKRMVSGLLKISIPSVEAPAVPSAEVRLPAGDVRVVGPSGEVLRTQRQFDRGALKPLYSAVDLDIDDPLQGAEADDIIAWVLDEVEGGPMFGDSRKLSTQSSSLYVTRATMNSRPAAAPKVLGLERHVAWVAGITLAAALFYAAALAAILWRRRQLTRRATARRGYPPAAPGPAPVAREA